MSDLVSDLNSLINSRVRNALATIEARGGLSGKTGKKVYDGGSSTSTGGGIASPLTESTRRVDSDGNVTTDGSGTLESLREYYDRSTILYTNDVLLAVEIKPIKSMTMTDANGAKVVFKFAEPKSVEEKE